MPRRFLLWIAAALIVLTVGAVYRGVAPNFPYLYDEADYMWAGTRGFSANYLDKNALSFPSFVQKGLELMRTPGKRSSFSEYIRSIGDINMYRHFHGPVYSYWLTLGQVFGLTDPGQYRGSGLLIHLATTLAAPLIFWWLFPQLPAWGGLLACLLVGFNRTALVTSMFITQHLAFILVSLLTLAVAARFLRDFDPRWFYAMMALLAVSYATVESAAFLTVGLAVALFLARRDLLTRFNGWRGLLAPTGRGLAAFALSLLVTWPMGLLTLNVLKGFLAMGYIAVARKTFSPMSFLDMWLAKFNGSPWEFSAFLLAIPLLWFARRRIPREAWPFLSYAVVFLLITMKMSVPYTHYLGSFTVTCAMILAIAVAAQPKPLVAVPAALIALSVIPMTLAYHAEAMEARADHPELQEILTYFAKPTPVQHWFVPFEYVTLLHFHHPDLRLTAYDIDWPEGRLAQEVAETKFPAGFVCAPQTCAQMQTALGPRLTNPEPVAQRLPQPLTAIQLRSAQ